MLRVLTVFGTRPEAIKLAPLLQAMRSRPEEFVSRVCVTAQHRHMLDQVLSLFDIVPDFDLDLMADDQSPSQIAAATLSRLQSILETEEPEWVLVQGDTTTTAAAALAAFYANVKVGHVEAGLRTGNKWQPFPEEINRRMVSLIADLHFAPTEHSRQNLLLEGVPDSHIVITGNTVIDSLQQVLRQTSPPQVKALLEQIRIEGNGAHRDGDYVSGANNNVEPRGHQPRIILVTAHRRENFGEPLTNIGDALRMIAARYQGSVHIIYPVHPNPNVDGPMRKCLSGVPGITLVPPLDYLSMSHLASRAYFIVTDSGGLQEEAPSLGKPVLVLREVTERPEGLEVGSALLVGRKTDDIVRAMARLLDDHGAYEAMTASDNPYGDGLAGGRILQSLLDYPGKEQ